MNETRKIVLITGAAKRIGHIIALEMAKAGWDIAIHYGKSKQEADETVKLVKAMGQKAICLGADLAQESEVEQLLPTCIEKLGLPDCIVNNASIFEYDDPSSFQYQNLTQHMAVNLAAPVLLTKIFAQCLKDYPLKKGVVVHLLDQKLDNLNPDFFSYTLSKSALNTAVTMQAMFFAPQLRVMGVAPGISLTSGDQSQAGFEEAHQAVLLGQSSTPEDIAQAILYITQAQAMTGSVLYVDGGQHLQSSPRDVMFLTQANKDI
jgi:NAD(P)-dependent dehydrogenase (short-subunit alcohol dehydrogenase family)